MRLSIITKLFISIFLIGIVLIGIGDLLITSRLATGVDLDRCRGYVNKFLNTYQISTDSISQPGYKPVFCTPGTEGIVFYSNDVISVYTITKPSDQEEIYALLKEIIGTNPPLPVEIEFYEKENWITWENKETGASGGSRGRETIIQKYKIR